MTHRTLPTPAHYSAANAENHGYSPNQAAVLEQAMAYRKAHALRPSASDKRDVHLLLIDLQKDFCFPEGTLYVAGRCGRGAIEDSKRICDFIYHNLEALTEITTTLDTHFAYQIFSAAFWQDENDQPLSPFREVTVADIDAGTARPNPAMAKWLCGGNYPWLLKQVRYYCEALEKAGKYRLYLWPQHCLLGSEGHALAGVIHEARLFHSYARCAQSSVEVKGGNPLTENYSILRPEVLSRFDGQPLAQRNAAFIDRLLRADAVIIAGQAASHCVKSSIDDLLEEIQAKDASLARKVYILEDCMSSVTVPNGSGGFLADFTEEAERALDRFRTAGMNVVSSTTPIDRWPGF